MFLLATGLLVLAVQAAPDPTLPGPAPVPVKQEKKICRSEANSYSRMAVQTCHTATEWKEIDQGKEADAEQLRKDRRLN